MEQTIFAVLRGSSCKFLPRLDQLVPHVCYRRLICSRLSTPIYDPNDCPIREPQGCILWQVLHVLSANTRSNRIVENVQWPYSCSQVRPKSTATHSVPITDDHDLSGTVLGLSAHFAAIFLPKLHRKPSIHQSLKILMRFADDFTIFSIIVPSLSIFVFFVTYDCCAITLGCP